MNRPGNGDKYVTNRQLYEELNKIRVLVYIGLGGIAGQYAPVASQALKSGAAQLWRFLT